MADATTPATNGTITHADVQDVEELLSDMKERANKAHSDGNVIMLGMYAEMVRVVSPVLAQLQARKEREDRATINRRHKEMRKARRDAQQQQQSA